MRVLPILNQSPRTWFASGFLIAVLLFVGLIALSVYEERRSIAQRKATGLGAVAADWKPLSLWKQRSLGGVIGGLVGGVPGMSRSSYGFAMASADTAEPASDRQIIRTANMSIIARRPSDVLDRIRAMSEGMGGFVVRSNLSGMRDAARSANIEVRLPAARLDEARAEVRKLAVAVEADTTEARDVTHQYVDQQAHLRNLRAQEVQYLAILKRAGSVKDVLNVTEKLTETRGASEALEAEIKSMEREVAMSLLAVSVVAEQEAQVLGIRWRPLYQIKLSLRSALEGIADYATSMVSLVMYVPVILLWVLTAFVIAKLGWKLLRALARVFFPNVRLPGRGETAAAG